MLKRVIIGTLQATMENVVAGHFEIRRTGSWNGYWFQSQSMPWTGTATAILIAVGGEYEAVWTCGANMAKAHQSSDALLSAGDADFLKLGGHAETSRIPGP